MLLAVGVISGLSLISLCLLRRKTTTTNTFFYVLDFAEHAVVILFSAPIASPMHWCTSYRTARFTRLSTFVEAHWLRLRRTSAFTCVTYPPDIYEYSFWLDIDLSCSSVFATCFVYLSLVVASSRTLATSPFSCVNAYSYLLLFTKHTMNTAFFDAFVQC